jgi:peptide/nickel transport system substrate-binding protein
MTTVVRAIVVGFILAGLLAVCACAASEGTKNETVVIEGDDWGYPSPFAFYARGPGYIRMSWIFDTLTWKDENGTIPWLADKWSSSPDGKEWTFELHEGVKWHDGQPLTADDVKFTFDYFKANLAGLRWFAALADVDRVEVKSDHEVAIYLTGPVASFLDEIAGNVPVIPEHVWKNVQDPAKFTGSEAVVGTGPFKLAEYDKEEGIYIYDANEEFFKGKPLVSRLVSTRVSDPALALKTDTVDAAFFWGKEIDVVKELEGDRRFEAISGPSFWVLQVIFNCQKSPTDRADFRKAVAYAIDREEIVEKVTHGGAIVANPGIIHPESEWYNPNVTAYTYDPARAAELLDSLDFIDRDEDGIRETPQGDELRFVLLASAEFTREGEIIKDNLAAVGIGVTVKALDWSTIDGIVREGDFHLAISGQGGIASPAILESPGWPSMTYENEEYDALYREQSQTIDVAERLELVKQLQAMVADDLPVFALYHPLIWCVFNPDKLDTWFYTKNGVATGIPTEENKLVFIER